LVFKLVLWLILLLCYFYANLCFKNETTKYFA